MWVAMGKLWLVGMGGIVRRCEWEEFGNFLRSKWCHGFLFK